MTIFRSANPFDDLPRAVKSLIIIDGIIFLVQMVFPEVFIRYLALRPVDVFEKFYVWQLVTYAFLHGNFWHLFFNMFALWMFGPHVERAMGTSWFLKLFAVSVLGAALTQSVVAPQSLVVGASGGIYGILMAFGIFFPDAVIYLFFIFPLRAIQAVLFIALLTFVMAVSSGGSKVAHFAHLGGLFTGLFYIKFPAWKERFSWWRSTRVLRRPKGKHSTPRTEDPAWKLQMEVDRILDKISASGLESLTPEEHEVMRSYAKKKR